MEAVDAFKRDFMSDLKFSFTDHPSLQQNAGNYVVIAVDCARVLESWRRSLFSYEWLRRDGSIKIPEELGIAEQEKRAAVMADLAGGKPLKRPLLGIGLLETAEFCMGRAEFLTLTDMGVKKLDVHIRKDLENDFKNFLTALPLNVNEEKGESYRG
jgi:hypothetical protein